MVDLARLCEKMMRMDETVWARHANPWSVYTRIPVLPLLMLAIWSRDWIGGYALVPVGVLVTWVWLNTRIFPVPKSTDAWACKATFGERLYLNRKQVAIPEHHRRWAAALMATATVGLPLAVYGVVVYDPWAVCVGVGITVVQKLWFLDRMVWLYEDMDRAGIKGPV